MKAYELERHIIDKHYEDTGEKKSIREVLRYYLYFKGLRIKEIANMFNTTDRSIYHLLLKLSMGIKKMNFI